MEHCQRILVLRSVPFGVVGWFFLDENIMSGSGLAEGWGAGLRLDSGAVENVRVLVLAVLSMSGFLMLSHKRE